MQRRGMVKEIPESVRLAMLSGNYTELSRLGKKGVAKKKEKKVFRFLVGSKEMSLEANEDICPVND